MLNVLFGLSDFGSLSLTTWRVWTRAGASGGKSSDQLLTAYCLPGTVFSAVSMKEVGILISILQMRKWGHKQVRLT